MRERSIYVKRNSLIKGGKMMHHSKRFIPLIILLAGALVFCLMPPAFADQGVILTNVDSISIGFGTQGNTAVPGGSGQMYIDDIGLHRPTE